MPLVESDSWRGLDNEITLHTLVVHAPAPLSQKYGPIQRQWYMVVSCGRWARRSGSLRITPASIPRLFSPCSNDVIQVALLTSLISLGSSEFADIRYLLYPSPTSLTSLHASGAAPLVWLFRKPIQLLGWPDNLRSSTFLNVRWPTIPAMPASMLKCLASTKNPLSLY